MEALRPIAARGSRGARKLVLETPLRASSRYRRSIACFGRLVTMQCESVTMSTSVVLGMFGIGQYELLIVAGIALLLFGHRLPSVMRSLGRGVTEFKKGVQGIENDIKTPVPQTAKRPSKVPVKEEGKASNVEAPHG